MLKTQWKISTDISKSFGSSIADSDGDNWTITAGIGQSSVSGSGLSNLGFDSRINSVSTNVGLTTTLTDFMGLNQITP